MAARTGRGEDWGHSLLQAPVPSAGCGHGAPIQLANRLHDYGYWELGVGATPGHGEGQFDHKERHALKGFALAEFLLRRDASSMKKELIAANLTLTDGESTRLWQVYGQYAADMSKINGSRTTILKEYSKAYDTLTDGQADNLVRRWLETDIEQGKLRQQFAAIFRKVLPGKKAATFLQLERRISTMMDMQLTSQLPLAQNHE